MAITYYGQRIFATAVSEATPDVTLDDFADHLFKTQGERLRAQAAREYTMHIRPFCKTAIGWKQ